MAPASYTSASHASCAPPCVIEAPEAAIVAKPDVAKPAAEPAVTTKPAAANLTAEPMATEPAAAEPKLKPAAESATEPATEPATELAQASRRRPSRRRAPPGCRQHGLSTMWRAGCVSAVDGGPRTERRRWPPPHQARRRQQSARLGGMEALGAAWEALGAAEAMSQRSILRSIRSSRSATV